MMQLRTQSAGLREKGLLQGFWKRLAMILFVSLSAELCTLSCVYAAFEDKGAGARPTALGDTYVALGNDVQSLMVNPAGLAQLRVHELTSEYSKLYAGLSDGSNLAQYFMAYGQPIKYGGSLALGWKQFSLDNLYTERTISLGYGEWITDRVAVGGAIKQLYHSFGVPSMVVDNNGQIQSGTPQFFAQNGNSNTAYSSDLGALAKLTSRHTVGFSVQDINEPNIALSSSDHEIVPRTVRLGLDYHPRAGLNLLGSVSQRQTLANQTDTIWTGAFEKWWQSKDSGDFAARGSLANGSREFRQLSMGASYRLYQFQIDYAFVFNLSGITFGDTAGTHRFSLSYRFGSKEAGRKNLASREKPVTVPVPEVVPMAVQPSSYYAQPDITIEEISVMLTRDVDSDGVPDDLDHCENTPAGVEVDMKGCPPDTDLDGVPDYLDQCPNTLRGTGVDQLGCQLPTRVEIEFLPY